MTLPATDANLETPYTPQDYLDVETDNDVFVAQCGSAQFVIHEYKDTNTNSADIIVLVWRGEVSIAASIATVYLQIYNQNTTTWETQYTDSTTAADTEFEMNATINSSISDYYDGGNEISCRIYQEVPSSFGDGFGDGFG